MALARGLAPHTGFLACPWFLAGTVAVSDTDRDVCRQGLLDCGPEKVWEDDLVVLERVWREMDRTGRAEDWRDLIDREGLMVAFF